MNIIFLFSGTARTFPFNNDSSKRRTKILESYNKYIFTEKFKSLYNYKIYISTDDIHVEDTINYFNINNIGNIHLLNTDFYLKQPKMKTTNIQKYLNKYINKDWTNHQKYENSIHQHYKILDCYNLLKNDEEMFQKYDYIVRLRMDVEINNNILDILSFFTKNIELQIVLCWDFFALGKPKIMHCYCSGLDNNYGEYCYNTCLPDKLPIMHDYSKLEKFKWTYAAERQLFEMMFEYCNQNELDINKSIKSNNFCKIIRA
jgi:hypothetical protein